MNDNNTVDCTIKEVYDQVEEFIRKQNEYTEKILAEIITNYDFIVGSRECKDMLMEILPEGASIVCSPFIASPTMIYAIKKFDVVDLIMGTQAEDEEQA